MPLATKRPCSISGCNNAAIKNGKCKEHAREYNYSLTNREFQWMYHTKDWKVLKTNQLRKQSWCNSCSSTRFLQVDHIIPHNGDAEKFFDQNNLQTLCRGCHSSKTAKETGFNVRGRRSDSLQLRLNTSRPSNAKTDASPVQNLIARKWIF